MSNVELEQILAGKRAMYVLDLSWHLHRSYHVFRDMGVDLSGWVRPTGHVYGVLNTIKMIERADPDSVIIVTQDGIPVRRNEIMQKVGLTGYKEGRPELEFDFYKDISLVKAAVCILPNVYWAYNEDKECDDEMYALCKQAESISSYQGKNYVYSGDNDLLQAIDDRTVVIRNKTARGWDEIDNTVLVTNERFTKKFHGVDAQHIVYFRSIVGDSSDSIPGIPRFNRQVAYSIAMSITSWPEVNFQPITKTEKKYYDLYCQNFEQVKRNYSLMKLDEDYHVKLTKPSVNQEKLSSLLDKLQLSTYKAYLRREGVLK